LASILPSSYLKEDYHIFGLDKITNYYNIKLKYTRFAETGIYGFEETNPQKEKTENANR
jgi:hypothetical protein